MNWFTGLSKKARIIIITIVSLIVSLCIVVLLVYNFVNNTRNTGIRLERQLTSQYLDNQNYLSAYIAGFHEQVNIANVQADIVNDILLDAVKGRYDEGGFSMNSPMFAAVVEAYPEAGVEQVAANWGKIQDYISAGRAGYRATQSKLLDQLRAYDTWRETGLVKSALVRLLGFPSDNLEAIIGENRLTGELARQKMYQIVLVSEARDAYNTGTDKPLSVED